MERPPRGGQPKYSLTEEDETQPKGKRSRVVRPLVMPECDETVAPEHQALLHAAAEGDLEFIRRNIGAEYFQRDNVLGPLRIERNNKYYYCLDVKGRGVLCFAALNRHYEVFEFLLPQSPYEVIRLGDELLAALRSSDERIVTLFVNRLFPAFYEVYRALFIALITDSDEPIQAALNAMTFQDILGNESQLYRPLHAAVFFNSAIGMKQILTRGCPIDILNSKSHTALSFAVDWNRVVMVEELLLSGADANSTTPNDNDPLPLLYVATRDEQTAVLNLLLEYGGDANQGQGDESGWRLLHEAAYKGNLDCALALLKRGAEINACDQRGQTPLHAIAEDGVSFDGARIVRFLLEHGADVDVRVTAGEDAGKTLLDRVLEDMRDSIEDNYFLRNRGNNVQSHIDLVKELLLWNARIRDQDVGFLRKIFKKKPLLLAVLLGKSIAIAARNAELQDRNEALQFAVARREGCIRALIGYGAEAQVGLEMVDEILRRKYLTPEEREVYEAIRDTLIGCGVPSLLGSIIRRENIHDAMIQNPHFALMPRELKERLLHAILLSGMRSFNRDRISRALAAGADPAPFLYLVPELKDHPEIADLLVLAAQSKKIPCTIPDWLVPFRRTVAQALEQGDSSYIRLLMQAGLKEK